MLDFYFLALASLVVLEAFSQGLVQVGNLMVLAYVVLHRSTVERPDKLDTGNSALTCLRATELFLEDRVTHHAHVLQVQELV